MNPANRPRCWKTTNAVIATKSTPMASSTVPATSSELRSVDRIRSNATPDRTNINWVTSPTVVSTITLDAACAPGTPRKWARRILATSPPTLATGNSELMDSRIHWIQMRVTVCGRLAAGMSSRHERALKVKGIR